MKLVINYPDECADHPVCVFNRGLLGYCLCYEHYHVRHGTPAEREAYFEKYPERRNDKCLHGP